MSGTIKLIDSLDASEVAVVHCAVERKAGSKFRERIPQEIGAKGVYCRKVASR